MPLFRCLADSCAAGYRRMDRISLKALCVSEGECPNKAHTSITQLNKDRPRKSKPIEIVTGVKLPEKVELF